MRARSAWKKVRDASSGWASLLLLNPDGTVQLARFACRRRLAGPGSSQPPYTGARPGRFSVPPTPDRGFDLCVHPE